MKILLSGHAISPVHGSEPGVAWAWAWSLSEDHEVHILTFPEFKSEVEEYLKYNNRPNLHIHWVVHPLDNWNRNKGTKGLSIKIHYVLWQIQCLKYATKLCNSVSFDVCHHMSWSTISSPPSLWRLPVPFIWGPVGGGMITAREYRSLLGRDYLSDLLRTIRVMSLKYSPALRNSVKHSKKILSANNDTSKILRQAGANENNIELFLDTGLNETQIVQEPRTFTDKHLKILWAGSIIPIKGLPILIYALSKLKSDDIELTVAGSGSDMERCVRLVYEYNLGHKIKFVGYKTHREMHLLFASSHLFIFTGVRDSFGGVMLEALASGLPVMALKHQGAASFLNEDVAILIEPGSVAVTSQRIADKLDEVLKKNEILEKLSANTNKFIENESWSIRAKRAVQIYKEII
jgi:glycosyltransferase involved in cell wall biosynthesis